MAKLATGQVEPDEVGGGQVADGGLVETNEGGDAQSVAHCGEAFMRAEAGYQDDVRHNGNFARTLLSTPPNSSAAC